MKTAVDPLTVACPACEAVVGIRCRSRKMKLLSKPHEERVEAALAVVTVSEAATIEDEPSEVDLRDVPVEDVPHADLAATETEVRAIEEELKGTAETEPTPGLAGTMPEPPAESIEDLLKAQGVEPTTADDWATPEFQARQEALRSAPTTKPGVNADGKKAVGGRGVKFAGHLVACNVVANPKKPGSKTFERFKQYAEGKTVEQLLKDGVQRVDLDWDVDHGFLQLVEPAVYQAMLDGEVPNADTTPTDTTKPTA